MAGLFEPVVSSLIFSCLNERAGTVMKPEWFVIEVISISEVLPDVLLSALVAGIATASIEVCVSNSMVSNRSVGREMSLILRNCSMFADVIADSRFFS